MNELAMSFRFETAEVRTMLINKGPCLLEWMLPWHWVIQIHVMHLQNT